MSSLAKLVITSFVLVVIAPIRCKTEPAISPATLFTHAGLSENLTSATAKYHGPRNIAMFDSSNNPCNITRAKDEVAVDCSKKKLTSIPTLPLLSSSIRLDHNKLTNITDTPFEGMGILIMLNLSYNPLAYISPNVFKGLVNLRRLYLTKTQLYLQDDLDLGCLFSDTKELKEVSLTFSSSYGFPKICFDVRYGVPVFSNITVLHKIKSLEIEALIFKSLTLFQNESNDSIIRTLILQNAYSNCNVNPLQKWHFMSFQSLQKLSINNFLAIILRIEEDAFTALNQLQELDINTQGAVCIGNRDSPKTIDDFIHNVTFSISSLENITEVRLERIGCVVERGYKLQGSHALLDISYSRSIKTLSLNNNYFDIIQFYFTPYLPRSLIRLELSGNCIDVHLLSDIIFKRLAIEYIDARYQDVCKVQHRSLIPSHREYRRQTRWPVVSHLRELNFSHSSGVHYIFRFPNSMIFPNLTHMEYSWLSSGDAFMPSTFSAERPNLHFLDLTGSNFVNIEKDALRNANAMKTLYLSSNALGRMGLNLTKELRHLHSLQNLHLAYNEIGILNDDAFQSMNDLRELVLRGNVLEKFSLSVNHMRNLRLLDISHNKIKMLQPTTLSELERIRQLSPIHLDMSGNPLLCTCKSLEFLRLMTRTKVLIINKSNTSCTYSNGTKMPFSYLETIVADLSSSCKSYTVLAIVCSAVAALCLAVLFSGLAYRYRWKLRYVYYMTKLRFANVLHDDNRLFDYDAFISYSSDDFEIARAGCIENLENARNLELFIHERDFKPGEAIAYNISVGIHSCKRTILFISESFLLSEWCIYELNIARMEALYSKRIVLLIVILENSVINKLPLEIVDIIRTETYLEYPEHGDENDVNVFWERLADFIRGT